ncbi:MAG: T9SS type A sorting domain-containing protein [Flavobacteriales bacterium]|jgi:hypothetical protein|nr:T9SS type A sorting domain-containing protein [Flavobacteriales bacterium]MBT4706095.1 T9SS type A sorting domain-containing protein [Flavobacteriales bacterium]MBT4930658.1 T9SS type A sorting domain-containing protein [Flavobacteriales bacterium]MBT5133338.1 T9SS type A sorting domain-containing protein [Flavobacteriales bacterium]MBT5976775.1 T9SS type A sorting domain-containing protein [Flavobacteriales bacterium]
MVRTLLSFLTILAIGTLNAQTLLVDQTASPAGQGSASQDFETTYNTYDCMQADDFEIPNGEAWQIDSVRIIGTYSSGAVTTSGLVARFMNNHVNNKPGSLVWDTIISANMDPDGDGTIVGDISNDPLTLGPGTYWLGASARKDFAGGGGQWFWSHDNDSVLSDIHWRNPSTGFGNGCANWGKSENCLSTVAPAAMYQVYGCKIVGVGAIGEDTSFCEGGSVTYDVTSTGATSYVWSTGATTSSITTDSTGTYSVTITFSGGCISEVVQTVNVTVNTEYPVVLEDDTICAGGSPATYVAPNCGNCTWVWHDSTTAAFYTTTQQGWVSITVTDASGCAGTDSAYVTVEEPDVQIAQGDSLDLCAGDTLTLSTVNAFAEYDWSIDNGSGWVYMGDSAVIGATEGGFYLVEITTDAGCLASDTIIVYERQLPIVNITQSWTNDWRVKLNAGAGFVFYEWSNGKTSQTINTSTNKTYTVTVTDEYGCQGTDQIVVIVAGAEDLTDKGIRVFPNPSSDIVNVVLPPNSEFGTVRIIDALGREVTSLTMIKSAAQIDVSMLEPGAYQLAINVDRKDHFVTLLIE